MRSCSIFAILGLLVVSACGGTDTPQETGPNITKVEPSEVRGTVWGMVLQAGSHEALEGARVSLSVADEIRSTEAEEMGLFSFGDVPAGGEVGLSISFEGYSRATLKARVPAEAGDFPVENIGAFVGPVALFPLDGTADVQLLGHDGQVVNDASARAVASAAWVDLEEGARQVGFISTASTSANGRLDFSGLPNLSDLALYDGRVSFIVDPVFDGDDLRYLGHSESHSAAYLAARGGRVTITLAPPGENHPLLPIASNVGSLLSSGGTPLPGDSVVGINEAIRVAFNQPLDPNTLEATVYDQGGEVIHPTLSRIDDGNVVRIAPDGETYLGGRAYRVLLEVQAAATGSIHNRVRRHGSFFATPLDQEVKVIGARMVDNSGSDSLEAGDEVFIDLSQAIGLGQGRTDLSFPIYLNHDLNGSGTTGDARGEIGSDDPIWAQTAEPVPPSPMQRSGFTRHFRFVMPNVPPEDPMADPYSFGSGVGITFMMDLSTNPPTRHERLMNPAGKVVHTPSELETINVGF